MRNGNYTANTAKGGSHAIEFDYEAMNEDSEQAIIAFLSEYGPLILQARDVLKSYSATTQGTNYEQALRTFARTGEEPTSEFVGTIANRFTDHPQLAALKNSAYKSSLKAIGLGASFEAEFIVGVQYGAEGIVVFPYSIGSNYKTPWNAVSRTWNYKTLQGVLGITAGLGLSFWLSPPESSTKCTGVFLGAAFLVGARVELFGWLPEDSTDVSPLRKRVNPFNYIMAFRVVLEAGIGLAIGLDRPFKSKQKVSAPKLEGSSFFLEPEFMTLGDDTTLNFTITSPTRLGNPAKVFLKNESTLTLNFPASISDCIDTIVHTPTGNAPAEGTSINGLVNWTMGTPSDGSITITWQGDDNHAWSSDMIFNITNAVSNISQTTETNGVVTAKMNNLQSVGKVNVPITQGAAKLGLKKVQFTASLTWTLTVDGQLCSIYESSDLKMNGTGTADSSLSPDAGTSFYYVTTSASNEDDEDDDPPLLTIIDNGKQTLWNMGYEFEQDPSNSSTARIRAVMWKNGSTYAREGAKYVATPWQGFGAGSTAYYNGNTNITFTVTATQSNA